MDDITTDLRMLDFWPEDKIDEDMAIKLLSLPQLVDDIKQTTDEKNMNEYLVKLKSFVLFPIGFIPITTIIRTGVVDTLVDILYEGNLENRREASWIIGNLLSGNTDQIKFIINLGIIDAYINILNTMECDELIGNALLAIYNILCDSDETRGPLLDRGIQEIITNSESKTTNKRLIEKFKWFTTYD